MTLSQAKKLQNHDEVVVKSSFSGESFTASICGDGKEIVNDGKKHLVFDLFLPDGGLVKDVSHKFLS